MMLLRGISCFFLNFKLRSRFWGQAGSCTDQQRAEELPTFVPSAVRPCELTMWCCCESGAQEELNQVAVLPSSFAEVKLLEAEASWVGWAEMLDVQIWSKLPMNCFRHDFFFGDRSSQSRSSRPLPGGMVPPSSPSHF